MLPEDYCKKDPSNFSTEIFVSKVGNPMCPTFGQLLRKTLVSIKLLSAILGPEMAAPILWTPGKNAFFLQEKPMSIKFLVLGGGYFGFWGGRGECRFYFYGRADFWSTSSQPDFVCGLGRKKQYEIVQQDFAQRVAQ